MPTRSSRFTHSLLAGYGSIAINIVFSLASIPVALSYLPREEFGLWALALQINGYLALIDFGMSGAVGRFLADYKDDVNAPAYREHFATGFLVFLVQGLLVSATGFAFSYVAPSLLSIPMHLTDEFSFLLRSLCLVAAISIFSRTLASPLWAFQRMDVVNLGGAIGLVLQFFTMWLGFHMGYGVRSFVAASAVTVLTALLLYAWTSHKNGYLPAVGSWFRPTSAAFKQMFAYGRDGMLIAVGSQLINATQITIVSRILGLDAAASLSIATKLYGMCLVLFHKVIESAAPGLAEMYIRGEIDSFIRRYWDAILLTLATAIIGAVGIAAGNSAFISAWTGGKISWSPTGDFLLGLLVLAYSMSRAFMAVFGITKNLRPVRFLYFIEGIIFIPTAILATKWLGVEGVLAASLVVHLLVTLLASMRAAAKVLGSCKRLAGPLLSGLTLIALAAGISYFFVSNNWPVQATLTQAAIITLCSTGIVWFLVIPPMLRQMLIVKIQPLLGVFSNTR